MLSHEPRIMLWACRLDCLTVALSTSAEIRESWFSNNAICCLYVFRPCNFCFVIVDKTNQRGLKMASRNCVLCIGVPPLGPPETPNGGWLEVDYYSVM